MAIYVKSDSNSAETVNSSMDAITIASSFRSQSVGFAAPAIDIAASDSPLLSEAAQSEKRTIEYIDSDDPRPSHQESSSSSDDLELLEARAAAAEARLKLEEAKKKKKKGSSASRSSAKTRDSREHARRVEVFEMSPRLDDNENGNSVDNVVTRAPDQPPQPSILPVSDRWWFPSWGNRASVERDDGRGMAAFMADVDEVEINRRHDPEAVVAPPVDPQRQAQEKELKELREKLLALETKMSTPSAAPESLAPTSSSKESGFRTPRGHSPTTTDLIDLNTPPRKERVELDEEVAVLKAQMAGLIPMITHSAPPDLMNETEVVEAPPGLGGHRSVDVHAQELKRTTPELPDAPPLGPPGDDQDYEENYPPMVVQKTYIKQKVKEGDIIKLSALPEIPQFESWKIQVRSKVVAVSARRRGFRLDHGDRVSQCFVRGAR